MWLLTRVSLPHLRHHAARTGLTVLGTTLGVAAMVATTSVTDAVFDSFRHSVEVTVGRAQLTLTNAGSGMPEELIDEVRAVGGVAAAAPLVEGFVMVPGEAGEMLAVFGLDLLGDEQREAQVPRAALEIPDEVLFVSRPDSVVLTRSFASARRLGIDSRLAVLAPGGARELVVRGLVDDVGPATLFGGVVALMDLPAAQRLLQQEGRVDRIDVRVTDGVSAQDVRQGLVARVAGRVRVEDSTVHGAGATDLLFSVRVMLSIAALVAVVVGFFLIYHMSRPPTAAAPPSCRRSTEARLRSLWCPARGVESQRTSGGGVGWR
jgi:putative ABC transport system permease protein